MKTTLHLLRGAVFVLALLFVWSSGMTQAPLNDLPCNAIPVNMGDTVAFDLANATVDSNEVNPGPGAGTGNETCESQEGWCYFEADVQNSVWFSFQAPAGGCVNILADGFDTQLALWGVTDCGTYSTYSEIAANDDSGPKLGGNQLSSALIKASCLTPGATYLVQIDGFEGAQESGVLLVSDCGNAPLTVAIDSGRCQSRYIGYSGGQISDTVFIRAEANGGFPPYQYEWVQDSSIIYYSDDNSSIAVVPDAGTTYLCTVTDATGCSVFSTTNVELVDVSCSYTASAGQFRTQTQGGWGTRCRGNNPGCYRDANFNTAFPNGLTIGCSAGYSMTFTSPSALKDFLPSGSQPRALDQDYWNPSGRGRNGYKNVFAGQLTALSLSLGFDANDPAFGSSGAWLGDLVINSGTFAGWTVAELVEQANLALGGCSTQYSISDLNNALDMVNNAFVDGTATSSALSVPGVSVCENGVESCLDPGAVAGALASGARLGSCANTCDYTGDWFPPAVPCEVLTIRVYGDPFADYDNNWSLVDLTTGITIFDNINVASFILDEVDTCVNPTHCYALTMFDQASDGFTAFFPPNPFYEIVFGNDSIRSEFTIPGASETITVGNCSNREAADEITQDVEISAYPNPFRVETQVDFRIPEATSAKVEIFNLQGQLVDVIFEGDVAAHQRVSAVFNGSASSQGIYFYRLTTGRGYSKEGKLILQK